jgi:crossover junction endodeoxyribonuclease RusA
MLARPSVQVVTLDLPTPISTNDIWKPVNRGKYASLVLSKAYLAWQAEAGFKLNTQRPGIVEGPYAVTIKVSHKWRGDLDNASKATSDLLQAHGVIENDKLAQRVLIERGDVEGMRVMVVSTKEASDA